MIGGTNTVGIVLDNLYPVGSIYIGTMSTCPLAALMPGTVWEAVSSGKVLQGSDNTHAANTTINAGLPNITGTGIWGKSGETTTSGAIYTYGGNEWGSTGNDGAAIFNAFDASRSNAIYGASTTVQPPAYVVNIWRRVQ